MKSVPLLAPICLAQIKSPFEVNFQKNKSLTWRGSPQESAVTLDVNRFVLALGSKSTVSAKEPEIIRSPTLFIRIPFTSEFMLTELFPARHDAKT